MKSIITVKKDLLHPPSSCHQMGRGGSDGGGSYLVLILYVCGEWEAALGNVHLQFFSSDTVGLLWSVRHREVSVNGEDNTTQMTR